MTINLNAVTINHPIFGMPIRTAFLAFICTFMPWAVPLCMPISGARPPYFGLMSWFFVKISGGNPNKIKVTIKDKC